MSRALTSAQHPLIKHWVRLREQRHYRRECGSLLLVGSSLVFEAAQHLSIQSLILLEEDSIASQITSRETFYLTPALMKKVAGTESFQGAIAEVPLPQFDPLTDCQAIIVCDRVSDPGNLGTLLRTALAFGWQGAFLLPGCCDPLNDKVLRSARGAPLRLPIQEGDWEELEEIIQKNQMQPLVADLHGISSHEIVPPQRLALFLGNEAHGVSERARALCSPVSIPMHGEMESLNVAVAGGILMYILQPNRPEKG